MGVYKIYIPFGEAAASNPYDTFDVLYDKLTGDGDFNSVTPADWNRMLKRWSVRTHIELTGALALTGTYQDYVAQYTEELTAFEAELDAKFDTEVEAA